MHPEPQQRTLAELEARLSELEVEREAVQAKIRDVQRKTPTAKLDCSHSLSAKTFPNAPLNKASSLPDKIRFFLDLIHGRRDVYAVRFENSKTGKSGYQPACANLWRRPLCQKPKIKCHECHHRMLLPLARHWPQ